MTAYMDTIIGHKLISEQKCLRKKLSLKDVTYGGLLEEVMSEINEIDKETFYDDICFALNTKIEENLVKNISLKNEGEGVGKSKIEKRISVLQLDFTNAYLKKALEYFQGMH
ncbi:hypothetical protein M0R72_04185 [Candidatus Pacearchaeota archaeon]|jgi:hypothetical protein|nr:hypothetical protein [Candidatus Pacearchaeota archaeon]